ncbi:hypothetical protein R3P38DRAFT_2805312 [Favolaschia claudopus]|uniref:Uncharacterized protein n=1 Tax=Favolaschia claudopus TaxID=2862362 RepID=A0AAV9ZNH0_9AGAR
MTQSRNWQLSGEVTGDEDKNKLRQRIGLKVKVVTCTETPRGLKDQREREKRGKEPGKGDYEVTLTVPPLFTAEERRDIAKPTKKMLKRVRGVTAKGRGLETELSLEMNPESVQEREQMPQKSIRKSKKRALEIVRIARPREIARGEKGCATKTKAFGHESREASKCERPRVESEKWRPKPSNPMRVRAGDTESLPRVRSEVEKKRREKIWRAEEPTSNSLIKDSGLHARKGTKERPLESDGGNGWFRRL